MYDFYPEWGPARHRDERDRVSQRRPRYWTASAAATRDGEGDRPDDN